MAPSGAGPSGSAGMTSLIFDPSPPMLHGSHPDGRPLTVADFHAGLQSLVALFTEAYTAAAGRLPNGQHPPAGQEHDVQAREQRQRNQEAQLALAHRYEEAVRMGAHLREQNEALAAQIERDRRLIAQLSQGGEPAPVQQSDFDTAGGPVPAAPSGPSSEDGPSRLHGGDDEHQQRPIHGPAFTPSSESPRAVDGHGPANRGSFSPSAVAHMPTHSGPSSPATAAGLISSTPPRSSPSSPSAVSVSPDALPRSPRPELHELQASRPDSGPAGDGMDMNM